ncbi:hypothetical protein ACJJTC_013244 [Scirpophaga incertulas]
MVDIGDTKTVFGSDNESSTFLNGWVRERVEIAVVPREVVVVSHTCGGVVTACSKSRIGHRERRARCHVARSRRRTARHRVCCACCDNYDDAARPAPPQSIGLRGGARGRSLLMESSIGNSATTSGPRTLRENFLLLFECLIARSLNSLREAGGSSRERVLSHLLNSSFTTAPLILPCSIGARESAHSLVNPSSPPYLCRVGRAAGGGAWGRRSRRPCTESTCEVWAGWSEAGAGSPGNGNWVSPGQPSTPANYVHAPPQDTRNGTKLCRKVYSVQSFALSSSGSSQDGTNLLHGCTGGGCGGVLVNGRDVAAHVRVWRCPLITVTLWPADNSFRNKSTWQPCDRPMNELLAARAAPSHYAPPLITATIGRYLAIYKRGSTCSRTTSVLTHLDSSTFARPL